MTLVIQHFDCRLNQWIYTIQGEILTEQLENTLLEKFFPDGSNRFSFGHIDEYSSPAELDNHPNGDVLLLASGKRLLYGPSEYLSRIQEICPDPKDRGAYGSIFLGSCQANINEKLNILVVDDEGVEIVDGQQLPTGEWEVEPGANGGILPPKEAFNLVGDCHGKITPTLAAKLAEGKTNKVIQHRLRFGESRFGKGTIAPWDLANLPFLDAQNQPQIDLVLPLSSFKGGDKKNNPIQPGLYENVPVWIGQKELSPDSNKSRTAISQVLATAPEGIVDFLPIVEQEARDLQGLQNDPRWVAREYIQDYEARMSKSSQPQDETNTEEEKPDAQLMYRLIKADLDSGHPKILETQKVQNELQRFLQNKWRDIATGKSIKFYRGMIIPSKNLREGEICDTRFVENAELLNFRSPYLNSNGMCVNINKYVPEAYSPTGDTLEGVIVVSDETLNRIRQRYREEGIEQPLPLETESQRQGRDFDGDTIGVELASKYPNFTAEVKRRNWAGYAYAPTPKEKKISFTNEDGSHWEFSRIAHFMADGMSVGFINNFVTATEALESEAELIIKQGDLDQKLLYLNQIVKHYRSLIQEEQKLAQNPEMTTTLIRDKFRERVTTIAAFQTVADTNMAQIDEMIDLNRSIYREMIEEGCYQNQIAVDMFKSARSPNMDIIQNNQRLLYRQVNYIRDKKDPQIYTSRNNQPRTIEVNGFSPVELIINQTNEIFALSSLQARPTVQFRNLFAETYSPQQKKIAEQQKLEFDQAFNAATRLNRALNREKGPALAIVTHQSTSLTLSNIVQYKHPLVFAEDNTLNLQPLKNLRLVQNNQPEYPLLAQAKDKDNRWQNLGAISETDCQQYNLVAGAEAMVAEAVLQPGLDRETVKLQFSQTFEQLEAWSRTITDDSERAAMAAAAWHVGSSRESADKADNADYKISNFSFYAFQNELCDRVANSAIIEFDLLNLNLTEIARNKDTEQLVQFSQDESGRPQLLDDKGSKLANLSQVSAQMPLETTAIGTITLQPAATAQLKLRGVSDPIKINKIAQGDFAQQNLNLEADIEIRLEKPTYPALTLNGKSLGRLDKDSVATLTTASALTPGASFDGTIETIGSGRGKQAQITTARGTILKTAQQYSAYNRHHFKGDSHRFTVQFVAENKTVPAIYLDNRRLGLVIDKESRSTLLKAGINQSQQIIKGAKIESNIRAAKLIVDPNSINYPPLGAWVKRYDPETSTLRAAETTPQQAFRHQLQGKDNIFLNPSKPMNTPKANPTNDKIEIYTDGSCLGNPGPGGWAAIINKAGASETQLTGSEPQTTNNRMELTAVIEALEALEQPSTAVIKSDSQYVINTIEKNWKRKANNDLWERLDRQLDTHNVQFQWVKGHAGNELNERCDQLAKSAASQPGQKKVTLSDESIAVTDDRPEAKTPVVQPKPSESRPQAKTPKASAAPSQPKQTSSSLNLPPLDDGFKPALLNEQAQRTQQVAPVVSALLNYKKTADYQGASYRATWNAERRELKLFDTQGTMKMSATATDKGWQSQPLPWPQHPVGLTDNDLQNMQVLAQNLQSAMGQNPPKSRNNKPER